MVFVDECNEPLQHHERGSFMQEKLTPRLSGAIVGRRQSCMQVRHTGLEEQKDRKHSIPNTTPSTKLHCIPSQPSTTTGHPVIKALSVSASRMPHSDTLPVNGMASLVCGQSQQHLQFNFKLTAILLFIASE